MSVVRRPPRGYTLLELILVVALVILFVVTAMRSLFFLLGTTEQVHVEHTLGALRSALGLELSRIMLRDGPAGAAALAGANPMELLAVPPQNYRGAHEVPPAERGIWYFDRGRRELVYRVRRTEHVAVHGAPEAELRFEIGVVYTDTNRDGRLDAQHDRLQYVELRARTPYTWHTDERDLWRWWTERFGR